MTGLLYDADCLAHDNGSMLADRHAEEWISVAHVEAPERISRCFQVLERSGRLDVLQRLDNCLASEEILHLVHSEALVARIKAASSGDQVESIGLDARAGPASWRPALKAVGGAVSAVDAVMAGAVDNAYVLVRPPGHHATATGAMGFCLFNNVAVACRHAQARYGVGRVAIIDWDVHHGNGTQEIFYEDPSVLFISIHQAGLFPKDSGSLEECGAGSGEGFNINIPLRAGAGDKGYALVFESIVEPAVRKFSPNLVLISAGQDASAEDPLGRMSLTTEGFREMATRVRTLALDLCGGRMVAVQEGGYSLDHLPFCTLAVIEAMAGLEPLLKVDPLAPDVPTRLQEFEEECVLAARNAHSRWWRL
jgi:acetoin utilization deacetylase AcuC-like enzyme